MGWIILILFIIVVLIVWIALTRNAKQTKPDFVTGAHGEEHPVEAPHEPMLSVRAAETIETVVEEPAANVSTSTPVIDDLKIVEGIGPKVSELLNAAGITNLTQLAAADVSHLRELLDSAGLRFLDPTTWPEQAHLAAEGQLEKLEALQTSLKGGRKTE